MNGEVLMSKKNITISLLLIVMVASVLYYSPVLFQEGNPLSIALGIAKLELTDDDIVAFSENARETKYVSRSSETSYTEVPALLLQGGEWEYEDQMGSALIFVQDDKEQIITMSKFTKHYIIWTLHHT